MSNKKDSGISDSFVPMSILKPAANKKLGITQEYNKENRDKLWDSQKGKTEYKEKIFENRQTYHDPISGEVLHKSQKAAQNKYHMKNKQGENVSSTWANHSAETDHINALKDVHNIAKHNPFLTDADFKEVMNSEENYRILPKSLNTAKGDKSDWQLIADKDSDISLEGKLYMAKEKVIADVTLQSKFATKTAQNIGNEFVSGATDTLVNSVIPLTAEAVRKMIHAAQGKQSLEEAASDIGKAAVNVAVAGGVNKLLADVISAQTNSNQSKILNNIVNSGEFSKIIAVATIVQESAAKYINGEITGEEFVEEVGEKGISMVAGMIGGQVGQEIGGIIGAIIGSAVLPGAGTVSGYVAGEAIGRVLGTIITTVACSAIVSFFHTSKHLEDYKLKDYQIRKLESEALKEIEKQRNEFHHIVEHQYKIWDDTIMNNFNQIITCACKETFNLQGVTSGLANILSLFGKDVAFKNLTEYESQLDMPLTLSF